MAEPRLPRLAATPGLWLAVRWLRARTGNRFLSLTGTLSVAGMVLGVAVLTLVMSVMNGFDRELKSRILGMATLVMVAADDPEAAMPVIADAVRAARLPVTGMAPYWEGQGMLTANGITRVVGLQGVDAARHGEVAIVGRHMVQGALGDLTGDGLVLGEPLRLNLGLRIGDAVALVVPRPAGAGVVPEILRLTLVGSFAVNAEVDYSLALVPLARIRAAGLAPAGRLGVRLATAEPAQAPVVAAALASRLQAVPGLGAVTDWSRDWGELFRAVAMEKVMMFLLLALVLAIAGFNIVATLAMLVQEQRGAIAMLRTIGLTPARAQAAFLLQGMVVGLVGVVGGLALGLLLAANIGDLVAALERLTGAAVLGGTYFERVPAEVHWPDLVLIALLTLATAAGAAWRPARQAAAISPVAALHGA